MGEVDGRRQRRAGNRQAVLDALVELFGEDRFQPSTVEISERAGISARSLFRYFDDQDDLVRAAIDHNLTAARPLLEIDIAPDTPTAEKVERIVAARMRLFEATAPAARAARVSAHRHEVLATQIRESRALLRAQLRRTFAPELDGDARRPLPRAGRALLVRDLRAAPAGPGHVVPARRKGPHRPRSSPSSRPRDLDPRGRWPDAAARSRRAGSASARAPRSRWTSGPPR